MKRNRTNAVPTRALLLLLAGCTGLVLAQPAGVDAQRERPARVAGPSSERGPDRLMDPGVSPEELADRLRSQLEQIDEMRTSLAETIERLEAGTPVGDALTQEQRRFLAAMLRRPSRRPGSGPGGWMDGGGLGDGRLDDRGREPGAPPGAADDHEAGRSGPLSDEQLAAIRVIIDEHIPMLATRLSQAEAEHPEAAERFLKRVAPRFRDILDLRERAPELVEVRIEELRTGMSIVAASRELRRLHLESPESPAVERKTGEIRALLTRQFDLRQQLERHRIEQQLMRLAETRDRLIEQAEGREQVIDDHLTRVLERALSDERRGERGTDGHNDRPKRRRPRD